MSAGQKVHVRVPKMIDGSIGWGDKYTIECLRGEERIDALARTIKSGTVDKQWLVDGVKADRVRVYLGNRHVGIQTLRGHMPWLPKPKPKPVRQEKPDMTTHDAARRIAPFESSRAPSGTGWMGERGDEHRDPQFSSPSITSEYHGHVAEPVLPGPGSSAPIDGPDED